MPRRLIRLWIVFSFAVLAPAYLALAIYAAGFHAFWSPDCGARFAMIESQIAHGRLIYIYYPGADLDPTGQIHPLAYFLFHRSHDFCVMYQPLFPLLSGLMYRAFGFDGLVVIPVVCGLGTLWTAERTALLLALRSRPFVPLLLGAATPLLLYSVVFWDHSAQMLLAALSGYWMLRSFQNHSERGSERSAAAAGVLLGLGVWVHEMFLALFAAAWLAALPFWKAKRSVLIGLPAGFVPVVLAWGVFNLWIYGTLGGPHLSTNLFQNTDDHPYSLALALDGSQFVERALIQLVGEPTLEWKDYFFACHVVFVCIPIIYAFSINVVQPISRFVNLLMTFLGLIAAILALTLLVEARGMTNGLFLATPLLIPALAVPWFLRSAHAPLPASEIFYAWAGRTCGLFVLFLLINPITPGEDWGSRYLLTALPLLFLLAAHALEQQYRQASGRLRTLAMVGAAGVVGISVVCQLNGLSYVRKCLAYSQALNTHLQAVDAPVLVTDMMFVDGLTPDVPPSQERFLMRTDGDERLLAQILRRRSPRIVAFAGGEGGADQVEAALNHARLPFTRHESRSLWEVNHSVQEGEDVQYVRFDLKQKSEAKKSEAKSVPVRAKQ